MLDVKTVRERLRTVYDSQVARHKKKLEKAAGAKVKIPSASVLPYSFDAFLDWAWARYGTRAHRCPYSGAPIDIISMQFDHIVPLNRGGRLDLSNIEGLSKAANELKGSQTPEEFRKLLAFLETLDTQHRSYLEQRIRAGAVANRMRFFPHQKKDSNPAEGKKPAAQQGRFDLEGADLGVF